jgi:aspartyl/glutamyl-tRNA(Asn/Gln) amidotransferase C subunit
MTDSITPETFAHLVDLAALELTPEEAEYLRKQLNNQLKAVEEMAAIPLDENIPLAAHGVPFSPQISPTLRKDNWEPSLDAPAIMSQVPQEADGYIVVPEIPHTELE